MRMDMYIFSSDMYIFPLLIICQKTCSSTRLVRVSSLKPNHDFSFAKLGPCTTVMIIALKKQTPNLSNSFHINIFCRMEEGQIMLPCSDPVTNST